MKSTAADGQTSSLHTEVITELNDQLGTRVFLVRKSRIDPTYLSALCSKGGLEEIRPRNIASIQAQLNFNSRSTFPLTYFAGQSDDPDFPIHFLRQAESVPIRPDLLR